MKLLLAPNLQGAVKKGLENPETQKETMQLSKKIGTIARIAYKVKEPTIDKAIVNPKDDCLKLDVISYSDGNKGITRRGSFDALDRMGDSKKIYSMFKDMREFCEKLLSKIDK